MQVWNLRNFTSIKTLAGELLNLDKNCIQMCLPVYAVMFTSSRTCTSGQTYNCQRILCVSPTVSTWHMNVRAPFLYIYMYTHTTISAFVCQSTRVSYCFYKAHECQSSSLLHASLFRRPRWESHARWRSSRRCYGSDGIVWPNMEALVSGNFLDPRDRDCHRNIRVWQFQAREPGKWHANCKGRPVGVCVTQAVHHLVEGSQQCHSESINSMNHGDDTHCSAIFSGFLTRSMPVSMSPETGYRGLTGHSCPAAVTVTFVLHFSSWMGTY
jgi:hypothetical protein